MPMLAVLCAAATSHAQPQPSAVINNQIQLGDVFDSQTINVVTVEEGVGAETGATGNSVLAAADRSDLAITSNQTMVGATRAQTVVNATAGLGDSSQINTTATGNVADLQANRATVTGVVTQIATFSDSATAIGQVEAETATAGDLGVATTAASNSASISLVNGSAGVRVNQSSAADVLADGGAVVQYVSGTADVSGVAAGNSVALVGTDSSAARIITSQTNTSGFVQASKFTAYGNVQTANTSANASGNVTAAVNDGPLLDVASNQYNEAYIRAQAEGSAYQFGAATVVAYGVGNSVLAGNNGEAVVLDNVQVNTGGGVEVIASFSGTTGYDAYTRATAIGNDATGYSCSSCTGTMSVNNRQTNNADVGATATTNVGSARSVNSSSTAIGNNASFFVSNPGN